MSKIIEYFKGVLSDSNGNPSSKRWVTILFTVLLAVGVILSIIKGQSGDPEIVRAMMYIIIAGLGMTGAERFAPSLSTAIDSVGGVINIHNDSSEPSPNHNPESRKL